jgi:DNA-binding NtrC family response regulator
MAAENILIVEDEELMRSILRQLIESLGHRAFTADSAESALEILSANDIDLTLTDIKMSGKDGLALLDQIKSIDAEAIVIIMTAFSSVDTAVAALRKGAYDYITKPFVNEDLLQTVKNALAHRRLFRENRFLRRELIRQNHYPEIIGESDAIKRVFELVDKVAATTASVLIQGESGTGKELVARAIHFNSNRSDKPFLAINCGALPESLLESELFGHVKGSFTGAVADKPGFFRSAAGGTLFLDEIGDMPFALQVKLLRALQEHEVTPVGASVPQPFDARIVTATNRRLESEVADGRFREDLYYRLNVVEIDVPSLRERREDIPVLIRHFVTSSSRSRGVPEKLITPAAMEALNAYSWPGNIRELEHTIERAMILADDAIDVESLPDKLLDITAVARSTAGATLDEIEQRYVLEILERVGEDKAAAAKILGIDLSTLYRKLKRYQL